MPQQPSVAPTHTDNNDIRAAKEGTTHFLQEKSAKANVLQSGLAYMQRWQAIHTPLSLQGWFKELIIPHQP